MIEDNDDDDDDDEVPFLVEVEKTLLDGSTAITVITSENSMIKIPVTILVGFLGSGYFDMAVFPSNRF